MGERSVSTGLGKDARSSISAGFMTSCDAVDSGSWRQRGGREVDAVNELGRLKPSSRGLQICKRSRVRLEDEVGMAVAKRGLMSDSRW